MANIDISVVTPVHNEEGNIVTLHERLTKTLKNMGKSFEIIYVENRSKDNTVAKLKELKNARVLVMRLPMMQYRTTQSIALDAGIKAAKGDLIITIDSDLQNPPEEIPKLVEKLEKEGLDVVSGWRKKRKDNVIIRNLSKFGGWMRKQVLNPGVHDLGCTLKVYRRECFEGLDLSGEMHRYLVAILRWRGFEVGEMVIEHAPRTSGKSSYNWSKAFRGFVDMWQIWFWKKYYDRPLHLFGVTGVFLGLFGAVMLFTLAILRILGLVSLSTSIWPLMAVFLVITGTQLFIFGIIIDLVIKNYYASGREPLYTLKEDLTL
ncbi:MAG: glycosyltransferase [Candidatus Dojkabacteria bacterium]